MSIRDAQATDYQALAAIYNHYIVNTVVTFEEETITAGEMGGRVEATQQHFPWLVAESEGVVVGYAYAAAWHARAAYRHTVESSVYLSADATGRGFGSELYGALIERLRRLRVRAVIGGASLPNPASVALHEKFGFEKAAHYREVGHKLGRWIDVGYWQLILRPRKEFNEVNPV